MATDRSRVAQPEFRIHTHVHVKIERDSDMPDKDVLMAFRARADAEDIGYRTLINQALREALSARTVNEPTPRKILREELAAAH